MKSTPTAAIAFAANRRPYLLDLTVRVLADEIERQRKADEDVGDTTSAYAMMYAESVAAGREALRLEEEAKGEAFAADLAIVAANQHENGPDALLRAIFGVAEAPRADPEPRVPADAHDQCP